MLLSVADEICCRHIITCGSDGDVHVYKGLNDNDPVSYRVGDAVYCVCYKVKALVIFLLCVSC